MRHVALMAAVLLTTMLSTPLLAAQSCPLPPPVPDVIRADRPDAIKRPGGPDGEDERQTRKNEAQIRRFVNFFTAETDGSIQADPAARLSVKQDGVTCLMESFAHADRAASLLRKSDAMQSGYEQQWALAGLSLAAFKLSRAGVSVSPQGLDWLHQLAGEVMAFHDQHGQLNNHLLWAALGVGTTGYLTHDSKLVEWANTKIHQSLMSTGDDGTLPREMARGEKASHYHFFAARPLLIYADVRSCFNDPMREDSAAVQRLVGALQHILANPQWLAPRAGAAQLIVHDSSWLEPLLTKTVPANLPDDNVGRNGGRMSTLVRALDCQ
ncbi:alginate lyase family protein [Ancylobacter sp. Lp-2]|uniref:alginate lyase family protein n=1 Tax=Ancylobacter sp. Lp-2 TaxID=2881339 RepID=UPI001E3FA1E3|nr:alginate lyase family protein [Ancylobacter sp. Lp-2]MCB4768357.1 alginate lyase family protein [Ancylobacter sp. Lp-2]